MTTKELINQYVTAHADNRWMDASELEALLTEFAEKLKEPASEDLVDAINNYCLNARKGYPRIKDETDLYICEAFKAGAQWQREQLMKDAKDVTIRMGRAANFIEHSWELDDYLQTFHSGQKVKVIIIKE